MFVFKRFDGKEPPPGHWAAVDADVREIWKAVICCPVCKKAGSIRTHTIADDGTVSPSIVCWDEKCSFHEFGQLEGWHPEDGKHEPLAD